MWLKSFVVIQLHPSELMALLSNRGDHLVILSPRGSLLFLTLIVP